MKFEFSKRILFTVEAICIADSIIDTNEHSSQNNNNNVLQ